MGCRKACELDSIRELDLPNFITGVLKKCTCNGQEIISRVRSLEINSSYSAWDFWQDIFLYGTECNKDEIDSFQSERTGRVGLGIIFDSLERLGFLNSNIRKLSTLVRNYCGYGFGGYVDSFRNGGTLNECYENYSGIYDDILEKVLEVLKKELTAKQYNMAVFDLTHWGNKEQIDVDNKGKWRYELGNMFETAPMTYYYSYFYFLTEDELCALDCARFNSQLHVADKIFETIFS